MNKALTARQVIASYGENAMVEGPTVELFQSLGWQTANLYAETFGTDGTEGRESEHEVILQRRLLDALKRLNPGLPADAYTQALDELSRDRSAMLPVNANQDLYRLIRDGVKVTLSDDDGSPTTETLRVVDWDDPDNNDFFLTQQMWVSGDMYRRRCDLLGFVNGLPLVFIELKGAKEPLKAAFEKNLSDYRGQSIPQLFHPNAFILLSNGSDTRIGTLTSEWEHFFEWKRINDEGEVGVVSLETAIRGLCDKARLLDIVENFVAFQEVRGGLIKLVAKNHQYLGVNKALAKVPSIREALGRLGVFWHTQGSGKSLSMVFFTQKVLRKLPGNWSFVIVTDRNELDEQIYKTFATTGAITGAEVQAKSGEHLKELLQANHRYVFTLIQKFHTRQGDRYPTLSEREDIIVITDEAHRSQYDLFALNMRNALPRAAFLGFTGTPLIAGQEELTREVFGEYVSVYDFARSIEDGATVPLYYENRIPELQLTNQDLNEDMERLLEDAELDEAQEALVARQFAREYHLITREERLETIAQDLVQHFVNRGYRGKAMMVSIDKATAVRMYDKVQAHWQAELKRLRQQLAKAQGEARETLAEKIALMESTDMAVVVSQSQNEVAELKKKGLDITPHRKRMVDEHLDVKFKDPDDPLRLVFVCAMWITGFDVPTCSTLYLDKPMKGHTLMQTIARANRVAAGKTAGLIVDYVGIFRSLQKALAIYAKPTGDGKTLPIEDKAALVEALMSQLEAARTFCEGQGVQLAPIIEADGLQRIGLIDQAVEALITHEAVKKDYLAMAGQVARLFKAILPDAAANEHAPEAVLVAFLAAKIRSLTPSPDISQVLGDVEDLLNDSIATESYRIGPTPKAEPIVDLGQIDFDKLRQQFEEGQQRAEAEKLKGLVNAKLTRMVRLNKSRVDFLEKFQKLIDEYNSGSKNLMAFFDELMDFAKGLKDEEKRALREGLDDEEELALFDILTKPEPRLTKVEEIQVKKAAQDLLKTLKQSKLVIDWREKMDARAKVQKTIRDTIRTLPPAYTPELKKEKISLAYAHVYDSYFGTGKSIYQTGAAP